MKKYNQTKINFTSKSNNLKCINPNVAGLDIGSGSVFACIQTINGEQQGASRSV